MQGRVAGGRGRQGSTESVQGGQGGRVGVWVRVGGGESTGSAREVGHRGRAHRKCATEDEGCRWVPKASAEEGMEARNGL